MASSITDHAKSKEKLAEANFKKIRLRRQKIFTDHRMKMIQKSLKPSQLLFPQSQRLATDSYKGNAAKVSDLLKQLRYESDVLEQMVESSTSDTEKIAQRDDCCRTIEKLRGIIQADNHSMRDGDSEIVAAFFQNNGIDLLLPFLKFEYFEKILSEALCCLANLVQSASQQKELMKQFVPDLLEKFMDPRNIKDHMDSYLIIIEHV